MSRNSILDVIRNTLRILSSEKEYSIKAISYKINSHWQTTLKALEFMKEVGLVKERKGNKTYYKEERLFRLNSRVKTPQEREK